MATITINGNTYSGKSITIRNGVVTIDGQRQGDSVSGVVEIRVAEGAIERLDTDASVNAGKVGIVNAGGSVNCDDVAGNVNAGGSVNCDRVGGHVTAGGSVRHG